MKRAVETTRRHYKPDDLRRHHKQDDMKKDRSLEQDYSLTQKEHSSKHNQHTSKREPTKHREAKKSNGCKKTTSGKINKLKELKKAKPRPAGIDIHFVKLLNESQTAVRNLHAQLSVLTAQTFATIANSAHATVQQTFYDYSWINAICMGSRK